VNKTAVFKSDLFLEHMAGFSHVESASRLRTIYDALATEEIGERLIYPEFGAAQRNMLELNHAADYVEKVAATAGKDYVSLDPDTQTSPLSYEAACLAAGAAITGTKMIFDGEISNGFCLVRPPGHHAEYNRAMGFCLFNNVAVAAHYAVNHLNLNRVLLVDWDLHHGNGTQNAFYDTDKVLYVSTHQSPYYPGTGAASEIGAGQGEGYTINVPLPAGLDDRAYAVIFNELLSPIAREYKPELILISAGYDIHQNDPLGGMGVTDTGFAYLTKVLLDLSLELCQGRLLACLEGGYDLAGLRSGVLATLAEMVGQSTLNDKIVMDLTTTSIPLMAMEETRDSVKKFWNI
jgi:acetoin utilization deacetylase AcuC-like enzyme